MTSVPSSEAAAAASIAHFTHPYPDHNLRPTNAASDAFLCGACKSPGTGAAYTCEHPDCTFTLHSACALISDEEAPTFFLHPEHPLRLLTESSHRKMGARIFCDLCRDYVRGMWYRCSPCNIDLHPLCVQLPQSHTDRAHPGHKMQLKVGPVQAQCSRCGSPCSECHYRCAECGFVAHLDCLLEVSGPVFWYRMAHSVVLGGGEGPAAPTAGDGSGRGKKKNGEQGRKHKKKEDAAGKMIASTLDLMGSIISIAN